MVYADMALKSIEGCLQDSGLEYIVDSVTESVAAVTITVRDTVINAWFDVKSQQYGFDLLNGGKKACTDIVSFREFLLSYIDICTNFIPSTKKVADAFSEYIGVQCVYDTFFGSVSDGYTAVYRVLTNDNMSIYVDSESDGNFNASLIEYNHDRTKYKSVRKRQYTFSEQEGLQMIKNMEWYTDMIYVGYYTSNDIQFIRLDERTVEITWVPSNLVVVADMVNSSPYEMFYQVKKINGFDVELSIDKSTLGVEIDSLDSLGVFLSRYVESHKDEFTCDKPVIQFEEKEKVVLDLTKSVDEGNESYKNNEEVANSDSNCDECSDESNGVDEEPIQESVEMTDACNDLYVCKVEGNNGVDSVRFRYNDKLYDMRVEVAEKFGLPACMICDSVARVKHRGVLVTDMELQAKTFAINISDDENMCIKLINDFFS